MRGLLLALILACLIPATLIDAEIIGDQESELLTVARRVALAHHERWDGKGYPYGLAGEAIPIEGRIEAMCDVFDALLSVLPYKSAWTTKDAASFVHLAEAFSTGQSVRN